MSKTAKDLTIEQHCKQMSGINNRAIHNYKMSKIVLFNRGYINE